ncbi:MAG TPA: methionyl-tRNA formyltransferase [Stellaceae bacterium]|nr:methionyl-tRNA formyltransferase [Stellaceae bacterium]
MRVAIIGQQAFGKAVLEAFLQRGDEVAGAFVAPEPPDAKPDPLAAAARARGLPVFPTAKYGAPESIDALRRLEADLAVMAYVLHFVPQSFCRVPRLGTIQFHPSLLPEHRGPSAMNWPIILGRKRTGLSIFRPVDGLDEGPVLLQKAVEIGPDDTLGSVYFDKIFPAGVAALLETADLLMAGKAEECPQPSEGASYQGRVRAAESRINWANAVDVVYDLIRGCDPSPGAWTTANGRRLHLFGARKAVAGTFAEVKGLRPGQVVAMRASSFTVHAQGGFIAVERCRYEGAGKISGGESGLAVGSILGE